MFGFFAPKTIEIKKPFNETSFLEGFQSYKANKPPEYDKFKYSSDLGLYEFGRQFAVIYNKPLFIKGKLSKDASEAYIAFRLRWHRFNSYRENFFDL